MPPTPRSSVTKFGEMLNILGIFFKYSAILKVFMQYVAEFWQKYAIGQILIFYIAK